MYPVHLPCRVYLCTSLVMNVKIFAISRRRFIRNFLYSYNNLHKIPSLQIRGCAILRQKFIRNFPASELEISRIARRDLCKVSPVSGAIFKAPFPRGVFVAEHFSLSSGEANKKIWLGARTHERRGRLLLETA